MSKANQSTGSKRSASVKRKKSFKKKVSKKKASKVTVAKGVEVTKEKKEKLEEKPGSSNTGEYTNVSPTNFAGRSGGASPYSFPIDSLARAKSALARAHFAPSPEGIRRAVYKAWPQLDPRNKKGNNGRRDSSKKEGVEKSKK